jgi:hypothetical protein
MLLLMLLNACDSGADASRPAVVTRSCSIQWSGSPEPAPAPVAPPVDPRPHRLPPERHEPPDRLVVAGAEAEGVISPRHHQEFISDSDPLGVGAWDRRVVRERSPRLAVL